MARKGLNEIPEETSLPLLLNALYAYTVHTPVLPKHVPAASQRLGHYCFQPSPLPSPVHAITIQSDFWLVSLPLDLPTSSLVSISLPE